MPAWFVSRRGEKDGPYSDAQLKGMAVGGTLTATDLIWKEGLPDWVAAGRVRGLFPVQSTVTGPPKPAPLPSMGPPPLPAASPTTGIPPLPPPSPGRDALPASATFGRRSYTVRRKVFNLFGGAFHLLDDSNNVIGYSKQKAFKLKEDIRVFSDEQMTTELLTIQARNIVDFSATYDVYDPLTGGTPLGSLRRRGWKSLVRDEWLVFSPNGAEIGTIREEGGLALLRRFIAWVNLFSPQRYSFSVAGTKVAWLATNRNPFVYRLHVSVTDGSAQTVSSQLILAGAILLAAVEGKQA